MNKIHKTIFMGMIVLCIVPAINAQEILTLDKAISIAETESPDLKRSMLNLEQFQKNLEAQRSALKSRFSLDVSPVGFSRNRRFDNRVSQWYTNENFQTNALFRVEQPILLTDGTLSLTNEFGWQSSFSDATETESKVFYNNLYLNLYQTQLSERKIAYTQALINYKIELLNLKIQSLYDFEKDGPVFPAELYLDKE